MAHVTFFEQPIGFGKTILAQAVAKTLGHRFFDGDDYSEPGPWNASRVSGSCGIVNARGYVVANASHIIVAYLLPHINWVFLRDSFAKASITCISVSLVADFYNICASERKLSSAEAARSDQTFAQGYGARSSNALQTRTDTAPFKHTTQDFAQRLEKPLINGVR